MLRILKLIRLKTCSIETHLPIGRTNRYTSNPNTRQNLKMLKENTKFMGEIPEEELSSGWSKGKGRIEKEGKRI